METSGLYKDRVYTIDEVAAIFRVPANTDRRLIRRGDLPAIRLGRVYRVPVSVIDRYFDLPEPSAQADESLGFGMLAGSLIPEGVEYVDQIRSTSKLTIREALADPELWRG